MRIGVYVDGFNLYYSARDLCGRGTPGWRWLDIRALAAELIADRANWPGAQIERLVYCTATIERGSNPSGYADQQTYLKVLKAGGIADEIAYGHYVTRVKIGPLATRGPKGKPILTRPQWAHHSSGRCWRRISECHLHGFVRPARGEGQRRQCRLTSASGHLEKGYNRVHTTRVLDWAAFSFTAI
jgi:hypothetical protein